VEAVRGALIAVGLAIVESRRAGDWWLLVARRPE
jgi:hypothetical protein